MDFQIIDKKRVFDKFIKIDEVKLKREKFRDNKFEEITRYHIARPKAVGVLLENVTSQQIILVEQFRYASLAKPTGNGWTLEILAGLIDEGETPLDAACREAVEESGYQINQLIPIFTYFTSIGISDEQIYLFYGQVTDRDKSGLGGGLEHQNEDLRIVEMDYPTLASKIRNGDINDGKTIIAAQWLALKRLNDKQLVRGS